MRRLLAVLAVSSSCVVTDALRPLLRQDIYKYDVGSSMSLHKASGDLISVIEARNAEVSRSTIEDMEAAFLLSSREREVEEQEVNDREKRFRISRRPRIYKALAGLISRPHWTSRNN